MMPIKTLPKILGEDQDDAINSMRNTLGGDTSESTPDSEIEKPVKGNPGTAKPAPLPKPQ